MNNSVCFECPKRSATCRPGCKDYLDEVKERRKENEHIRNQKVAERVVTDVLLGNHRSAKDAMVRRTGGRKKY